ncbi:MAG: patatin-like phospholipase family protein [Methylobacteriaceae bacterium]|nr:patatin-like phospholipase family protein [Methylobacteriaceae bacterium]
MSGPRIGLALGAGGARGFAHVVVLEILDELGLKPAAISGASMGAIVAAPYAAGLSGRDLRAYVLAMMRDRARAMATALQARAARGQWFSGFGNPVLIDGERFLDLFWPADVPETFEALRIPLKVVATDFFARSPVVFEAGPLTPAVAGSMAIPGLVKPVEAGGVALIDGGAVDPLPYDCLFERCDVVVACDVIGGPVGERRGAPTPFETMFAAAQIMQAAIVREKLAARAPHALLRPPVDAVRALDFFRAAQIFRACDEARDAMKRAIEAALTASSRKNP